ncbi:amidohydrolase [Sutterella sp.]|uniref:amidohydrolase n=1 Tax=Sutterella sp. TaxID=1981025 RepID=UPI0026DF6955|nr:amidohydrolase [Sutterella sp.]MDO5532094.1 amidohydrolase [Sutterella sp.]
MAFTEAQYIEEMIRTRRQIHQRPEEGWTEFETNWLVVERLREIGYTTILQGTKVINPDAVMGRDPKLVEAAIKRALEHGVPQEFIDATEGYTGTVAVLETGRPGPVTAFRCDMDCVLVTESDSPDHVPTACGFASKRPGFMHACGHDSHTSVGLEVARWLFDHKDELKGTFKLIFQPAEEGVRGAAAIAASGVVDDVNYLVGGHVGTSAKLGQVGLSEGGFLASTKIDLHFHGRPSHAGSDPEKGRSALMAACAAAMMMQGISRSGEGVTRISIGRLNAGEGRNVTPVHADMQLEVRGQTTEVNQYMVKSVQNIIEGVRHAYEVEIDFVKAGEAATLQCCPELIGIVEAAAKEVPGVESTFRTSKPSGSEDCTLLVNRVIEHGGQGAFFLFGCNHHGHHRADFEIQDETSMPVGFGVFRNVAKKLNGI